jgi:3-phosphoshikimate 1-carboxyvinyltransferase
MDRLEVKPAARIEGTASVPGDKSISHRLAMLAAVAEGTTTIHNYAESIDCASTLECLRRLGNTVRRNGNRLEIEAAGLTEQQHLPGNSMPEIPARRFASCRV